MNTDKVKLDINEQISKINQVFSNYWRKSYFNGILSNNLDSLENIHRKVTKNFKFCKDMSILLSSILVILSIINYFNIIDLVNLNKAGLMILFTIVFLTNTYRIYKVKVNLENKIYLLRLLDQIEKK